MCIKERITRHAEKFDGEETHIKKLRQSVMELADIMQKTEIILDNMETEDGG